MTISIQSSYTPSTRDYLINVLSQNPTSMTSGSYNTDSALTVLMDGRIVKPKSLRTKILHCLHAAHQGVDGMKARTNDTVYWPGMNVSIRNFRANCLTCATIAKPATGTHHHDSSSRMTIPTNNDGHIPDQSQCAPCPCR